jgi:nitric oxide reductase large subunit
MGLFDGVVGPFNSGGYVDNNTVSLGNMWSYGNRVSYDWDRDLLKDNLDELRQTVATQASKQMDYATIQALKVQLEEMVTPKEKTPEEKVIDIVKGGFEKKFGMTIQEFQEIYDDLVENSPEKLI